MKEKTKLQELGELSRALLERVKKLPPGAERQQFLTVLGWLRAQVDGLVEALKNDSVALRKRKPSPPR
jgi:hypothetical protein